jgi:hypothetical protein
MINLKQQSTDVILLHLFFSLNSLATSTDRIPLLSSFTDYIMELSELVEVVLTRHLEGRFNVQGYVIKDILLTYMEGDGRYNDEPFDSLYTAWGDSNVE